MKRLLWFVLLIPFAAHGQVVGPGFVNYVTSAPSGACSQGSIAQVVIGAGTVYTCQSGTWAQVSGSGSMTWPTTPGITVCTGTPCTAWGSSLTAPSGTIVGTTDTQTLSNKTFVAPALGTPASGVLSNTTGYPWNVLANGSGNLSITPGGTSIFNATTAVAQFFAFKNTTAATVSTPQNSPNFALCGREWVGSGADGEGCFNWQFVPAAGLNAGGNLALTHTGTGTGAYSVSFPGGVTAGASGGVGGTISFPEGTAATASSGNDLCYADSTLHLIKCSNNNGPFVPLPPVSPASGTSVTLPVGSAFFSCTSTCTITIPMPPINGIVPNQYCIRNGNNVSTVITLAALGSSGLYENTARTGYGTAGTGTLVSNGAAANMVCIVGLDATHYSTVNFNGTWTAN